MKNKQRGQKTAYLSVADYRKRTRVKVVALMRILQMSRFRVTGLLYPDRYPVELTDEEVIRIADLLVQSATYVRDYYGKAAA